MSWEKLDLRLTNITNSDGDVPEYFHILVSERARYKTMIRTMKTKGGLGNS